MLSRPVWPQLEGIAFGGDYNPEQWPREVWQQDVELMRKAGVNLVTVGMWSWSLLEPTEGDFDFAWLDELLDLLHDHGIAVDLGTPSAAPPAWFFARYPHTRVVTADGVSLGFGSRGMVSPHAPEYHEAIVRMASKLAERYADHPAVRMWHVHNEYGAPVAEDHSDNAARAFRAWLKDRYGDLDALNAAWGTAVWSQHYRDWDHINTPGTAPSVVNPAQKLDFARFTDAALRKCFILERDVIRARASQPITTNFMANQHWGIDMWAWADEVDLVSDDHYLVAEDEDAHIGLSIAADLTRSVAGGKPWLLLEHSTSGVNWQPRNVGKRPGEMARNSLAHLARGADGIMFFQWRAARHGQEKFHSAMIPHAGTDSRVFREVCQLGADLRKAAPLKGSSVKADVAMLWDFQSFWAQDLEWRPSVDLTHKSQIRAYYERLWRDGITVDFVLPGHDLTGYKFVVAPAQYMLSEADAHNLNSYVASGGVLVAAPFTAAVDENDAVHVGGYLAPLEPALGVRVEEYLPLRKRASVNVQLGDSNVGATIWTEHVEPTSAEVRGTYVDGPVPDKAAITRNAHGKGVGWYISTCLSARELQRVVEQVYADAGVRPADLPADVELVTRIGEDTAYTVAINHSEQKVSLPLAGIDLLADEEISHTLELERGKVAIVSHPHPLIDELNRKENT